MAVSLFVEPDGWSREWIPLGIAGSWQWPRCWFVDLSSNCRDHSYRWTLLLPQYGENVCGYDLTNHMSLRDCDSRRSNLFLVRRNCFATNARNDIENIMTIAIKVNNIGKQYKIGAAQQKFQYNMF